MISADKLADVLSPDYSLDQAGLRRRNHPGAQPTAKGGFGQTPDFH